jgi:hypothetical protein
MMGRWRRSIWVVLRLEEVLADDRGLQNEGMVEVAEMIAPDDEGDAAISHGVVIYNIMGDGACNLAGRGYVVS